MLQMRKKIAIAIVLLVATGCHGIMVPPAPLMFGPPAENRLRYRFAVPPPTNIEKHPFTLYGRKTTIQKRIIRVINAYSRFSTCIPIPKNKSGTVTGELKYARKKRADFLLRTNIPLFQGSFQGRNARVIPAYMLMFTFFGIPLACDVDAKTWRGEAIMDIKVIECSSGKQIYSSAISAGALYNFSLYEEKMERDFGRTEIRYMLGGIVLNNLMVSLIDDLNENFTRSLIKKEEEEPDSTPTPTPTITPVEDPST